MFTKRMGLSVGLLILGSLSYGLGGCSSSSDGPADSSSGGKGGATSASLAGSSGGASRTQASSSSGAGSQSSGGSKSTAGASGESGGASSSSLKGGSTSAGGAGGGNPGGGASGGTASASSGTGGASGGGSGGGTAKGGSSAGGGSATAGAAGSAAGGTATGGSAQGGSSGTGTGGSTGKSSPGCNAANPLKSGSFTEKIAGTDRQYFVDVPTDYDGSKPYRLIFAWHPLGGTAKGVVDDKYYQLKPLSSNTTIFVAANGLNGSNGEASGNGWWNVNGVDMQFFEAILAKLNANLCIDQERIFSTGFSFGGMMSYTLPFVFNVFRATAPCSGKVGVIPFTDKYPEKYQDPLPIMAFHGDADGFVKTALGKEFFAKYMARNKCGTATKKVSPDPCIEYQGCVVPTIWCEFSGGHNTWSEEPAAIWNFFKQF